MHLKFASQRVIQITAEATNDLNGDEIVDKITKFSKSLPQNTSETVPSETEDRGFDFNNIKLALKNDETCGMYNNISQIRFKTKILKSGLCDYSDILVKGAITVAGQGADTAAIAADRNDKKSNI